MWSLPKNNNNNKYEVCVSSSFLPFCSVELTDSGEHRRARSLGVTQVHADNINQKPIWVSPWCLCLTSGLREAPPKRLELCVSPGRGARPQLPAKEPPGRQAPGNRRLRFGFGGVTVHSGWRQRTELLWPALIGPRAHTEEQKLELG